MFLGNLFSSCCVILLTSQQTDIGENMTCLVEGANLLVIFFFYLEMSGNSDIWQFPRAQCDTKWIVTNCEGRSPKVKDIKGYLLADWLIWKQFDLFCFSLRILLLVTLVLGLFTIICLIDQVVLLSNPTSQIHLYTKVESSPAFMCLQLQLVSTRGRH